MNRTVVITGGTGGIGKELNRLFLSCGDRVYSLSRSNKEGVNNHYICDVTDEQSINAAIQKIKDADGKIDILIICAGLGLAGALETTPSHMEKRVFDVNFFGALNTVKAALKLMSEGGKIIFLSSASAFFSLPYRSIYSASKSALNMVAQGLYMELKHSGIQVCSVCAGEINTEFTENRLWHIGEDRYEEDLSAVKNELYEKKENRIPASLCAEKIFRKTNKKRLPPVFIIGAKYRLFYFFSKIMPARFLLYITMKLYGGKNRK